MFDKEVSPKIGAYFYPHDPEDPALLKRARAMGRDHLTDETLLVQQTQPLFPGHDQPKVYCLGDPEVTTWTDTDPEAINKHITLAKEHGIDYFIVDTYVGEVNGNRVEELARPLEVIRQEIRKHPDFGYCSMYCLRRPRVMIPIEPGIEEPDRLFDLTEGTFYAIIDHAAQRWNDDRYLREHDTDARHDEDFDAKRDLKPVIYLYGLTIDVLDRLRDHQWARVLGAQLSNYASKKFGTGVEIIAVAQSPLELPYLQDMRFSGYTTYAGLAEFMPHQFVKKIHPLSRIQLSKLIPPDPPAHLQTYFGQLARRIQEWVIHTISPAKNFIPSAVVGWDAFSRVIPVEGQNFLIPKYPAAPIIVDSTPEKFRKMLRVVGDFLYLNVRPELWFLPVCSWNEISEGNALLPRVVEDENGKHADDGYLRELKDFVEKELPVLCPPTTTGYWLQNIENNASSL